MKIRILIVILFTNLVVIFAQETIIISGQILDASTANALDLKLNNDFILPWDLSVQLTGLYFSKKNIPQGEQLGRASVDLGVKKNLWKKKGELILSASDIFNTFGIRQKIKSEGLAITYENYFETQIIRLGFNYKF